MLRRLWPPPALDEIAVTDAYADVGRGVVACMVSSVDGAATLGGVSGPLGDDADSAVFHALRARCDVVLVGADTVRVEGYGPAAVPVAVVSRSLALDETSAFFVDATHRPIVLTCESSPVERRAALASVADVRVVGSTSVDLPAAVRGLGVDRVLCEGGPSLLAQVITAGLLDELCLTVSPLTVGGDATRIARGVDAVGALSLAAVHAHGSSLFLRYRRAA